MSLILKLIDPFTSTVFPYRVTLFDLEVQVAAIKLKSPMHFLLPSGISNYLGKSTIIDPIADILGTNNFAVIVN